MDYPISELRIVNVRYVGSLEPCTYYMHKDQVAAFVEACVAVHFDPATKRKDAASLRKIDSHRLNLDTKNYWWSGEARLNDSYSSERVWVSPSELAEEARLEEMED